MKDITSCKSSRLGADAPHTKQEPKVLGFKRFTDNLSEPVKCMTYKEAYVMDYDAAIQLCETQDDIFWNPKEIAVEKDVHDIKVNMNEASQHGVTTTLKLFTKYEIKAGDDWWGERVKKMFPRPCIKRMSSCFSYFETNVHAVFYDKLNKALHLNTEDFYLSYKQDKILNERMEFIEDIIKSDDMMLSTAIFSMIEGVVLYASFAFLKHFQSKGKNQLLNVVRGINFSVRDENLHCVGGAFLYNLLKDELEANSIDKELFHQHIKENEDIIIKAAHQIFEHESYIIDMIFDKGPIEGITAIQLKNFVQSRINEVVKEIGIDPLYKIKYNPIAEWFYDGINSYQMHDFFTGVGNAYNRDWDESKFVWKVGEFK